MKKKMLKTIAMFIALLIGQQIIAQQVLHGRITDSNGEPLPGVNILIKGSMKGTITDLDGLYSIEVFMGDVIVISFVGMHNQEVEINEESFKKLSNIGEKIQSTKTREVKPIIPKFYDDPPLNNRLDIGKKPDENDDGVGFLDIKKNSIGKFSGRQDDFGSSILKDIIYNDSLKTYVFKFERPLRKHYEHFEFNGNISFDRVTGLPALQSDYSSGISQNGSFVYTPPTAGNSFCWGPHLSQLEYDGQGSDFYKNGNIVGLGSGNGQPVNIYHPADYFKTGLRLSNSLEYRITKNNHYFFARYINHNNTGVMPGSSNTGHSFNIGAKTRHIVGSAFFDWLKSEHNLYQANYARIMNSILTTPPEFDNANGVNTKQAVKNQDVYLTTTNNQRSYNSASVQNPYWLTANDPISIKSVHYGFNFSYNNEFGNNWNYDAGISLKKDQSQNNCGFVSFFNQQNGWFSEKNDDNISLNLVASLHKSFNIARFKFNNYIRYLFSYNRYAISKNDYLLSYSLSENLKIGEQSGNFEQNNKRAAGEIVIGHSNETSFYNFPIYYGGSLNIYHSNTSNKLYFLPNAFINFKIFEMYGRFAELFPGRIYFQYANSINEADFQNRPDHFNTINFNAHEFTDYCELKNVLFNYNLKPTIANNFSGGFVLNNIVHTGLGLSFDYYVKKSRDAVFPTQDPNFILIDNLADITNKGFEATISYVKTFYDATISFSKSTNKVDRLINGVNNQPIAGFADVYKSLVEGEEVGVIVGSRYLRTETGQLVIGTDGYPLVDTVKGIIGNPKADWVMNFNNTFRIKRFVLDILFEYKHGGQVWNGTKNVLDYHGVSKQAADSRNINAWVYNGVTEDGQVNNKPVDFANPTNDISAFRYVRYGYTGVAEDAIEDASWFKLKKLALSYNFGDFRNSNIRISTLKLSFWIENVFTITPYSGVDPQTALFGYDAAQGLDLFNAPSTRRFGFNLNVSF
jgi:hypothetical protein